MDQLSLPQRLYKRVAQVRAERLRAECVCSSNVLLFITDQQRWDTRRTLCRTPNLDRLARDGVAFDRCLTPNPLLLSRTCGASLPACYRYATGVGNNRQWPLERPTLPEVFRDAGYHVAYSGKWHLAATAAQRRSTTGWASGERWSSKKRLAERNYRDTYPYRIASCRSPVLSAREWGCWTTPFAAGGHMNDDFIVPAYVVDVVGQGAGGSPRGQAVFVAAAVVPRDHSGGARSRSQSGASTAILSSACRSVSRTSSNRLRAPPPPGRGSSRSRCQATALRNLRSRQRSRSRSSSRCSASPASRRLRNSLSTVWSNPAEVSLSERAYFQSMRARTASAAWSERSRRTGRGDQGEPLPRRGRLPARGEAVREVCIGEEGPSASRMRTYGLPVGKAARATWAVPAAQTGPAADGATREHLLVGLPAALRQHP